MKLVFNHIAKVLMWSALMFSGSWVWAHSKHVMPVAADKAMELYSEETDKSITNVKVIYNPIAEQINVSFKLSKEVAVSIKLMDALGNEILALANSTYEEGNHSLSFETQGKVTAGFYFVKLHSGTETVIKRISVR